MQIADLIAAMEADIRGVFFGSGLYSPANIRALLDYIRTLESDRDEAEAPHKLGRAITEKHNANS